MHSNSLCLSKPIKKNTASKKGFEKGDGYISTYVIFVQSVSWSASFFEEPINKAYLQMDCGYAVEWL